MFYIPPGSMMQLIDGRVLHKDHKTNMWKDNMGVPITEQQLQFMVSFPSFSADASSGGDSPAAVEAPAAPSTSLSAPFDDIVATVTSTEVFNTNRTISTTQGPLTLKLTFAAVGTYESFTLKTYKNDVQIDNYRGNASSGGVVRSLPGTFDNGDQLKFSLNVPTLGTINFDVTVGVVSPATVLDTFNLSN